MGEKQVVSGELSQLDRKDLGRLIATIPQSDHWLLRGVPLPVKLPNGKPLAITAPGVLGAAAIPAMLYWWEWWESPILWAVAVFLGFLAARVVEDILDDTLPPLDEYVEAKELLKAARKYDQVALGTEIQCIKTPNEPVQFSLPSIGATWTPRGDGDDRKDAAKVAATMRRTLPAVGVPEPVKAVEPPEPQAEPEPPTLAQEFAGYGDAIAARAAGDAASITSALDDIARHLDGTDAGDDITARTLQHMRDDALQAVQVYARLEVESVGIPLASGLTATQELQRTLGIIGDEAARLHRQGQALEADELSYLRRLSESRYSPSSLDTPDP